MADLSEFDVNVVTADTALVTTAETVVVSSNVVAIPREDALVAIIAWALLTLGTATTTVTPRIRRGTTTAGTAVGEANAETIKTAAGSTEPFFKIAFEQVSAAGTVQYSLTLAQAAATGNGSALEAGILVFVF